jgi:hypothetical protein
MATVNVYVTNSANGGATSPPRPSKKEIVYRVLSRALRDQLGDEMFARIEDIYTTSIAFRDAVASSPRGVQGERQDVAAAHKEALHKLLDLPLPQQLHVIRAFSYFSQVRICSWFILESATGRIGVRFTDTTYTRRVPCPNPLPRSF